MISNVGRELNWGDAVVIGIYVLALIGISVILWRAQK